MSSAKYILVVILEPKGELYLTKVLIHEVRSFGCLGGLHLMAEEEMQTRKAM